MHELASLFGLLLLAVAFCLAGCADTVKTVVPVRISLAMPSVAHSALDKGVGASSWLDLKSDSTADLGRFGNANLQYECGLDSLLARPLRSWQLPKVGKMLKQVHPFLRVQQENQNPSPILRLTVG